MAASSHRQQPLLNVDDDIGRIKSSTDVKPDGKEFRLTQQAYSPQRCACCGCLLSISALIGVIISIMYIIFAPWSDDQTDAIFAVSFGIGTVLFAICAYIIWIGRNNERWIYYVMNISIQENMIYVLLECTKNRWKILCKIPMSKLKSIGFKTRISSGTCTRAAAEAWVILALSDGRRLQMNQNECGINDTKIFVQQVNDYLDEVHKQREIEIRQNNQEFINQLIENGAIVVRDNVNRDGLSLRPENEGGDDLANNPTLQSNDAIMEEVKIQDDEMLKKCANCGVMMAIGHKFCDKCGREASFYENDEIQCVNCNGLVLKKSQFCPNCGAKTNETIV